jgi:hypothetical protein
MGMNDDHIQSYIDEFGEIPWNVMLISSRPLTEAEQAYALTLKPTGK